MKLFLLLSMISLSVPALAETHCIAHQGSFKQSPPNSLESIREAIHLGADGIEFDIRHTREGYPIVMHDRHLTTASSLPGKSCPTKTLISELSLQEIRENCGLKYGQSYFTIPTLEEALSLFGDEFVFIELKDRPSKITQEIILRYFQLRSEKLRIISFKVKYLDELIKNNNQFSFWQNVSGLDLDVAPWGTPDDYGVNVWNRLYMLGGKRYHQREASVWTVNRERRIRKYLKQGVNFITTDEVEMCLRLKTE